VPARQSAPTYFRIFTVTSLRQWRSNIAAKGRNGIATLAQGKAATSSGVVMKPQSSNVQPV
jgi:hypothetical protein